MKREKWKKMERKINAWAICNWDWEKAGRWIGTGDLKGCTKALICSAQKTLALRSNHIKIYSDKTSESPTCRMYGEKGEVTQV